MAIQPEQFAIWQFRRRGINIADLEARYRFFRCKLFPIVAKWPPNIGQEIDDGIIEETLMHEACHTSLDATHASHPNWINAQNADGMFISTYAQSYPTQEDIAESYVPWFAVRHRWSRISSSDRNTILSTIPNRLAYFDGINCNPSSPSPVLHTTVPSSQQLDVYPNPAVDVIYFEGDALQEQDIQVYNLLGQDLTAQTSYAYGVLDVSLLPKGYYILHVKGLTRKVYKQ